MNWKKKDVMLSATMVCSSSNGGIAYGRVPQGHPVIVDYFYHEEIRVTENTGKRNR